MLDSLTLYLDYVNNFLTITRFAEYYRLTREEAENIITLGRLAHNNS